MAPSTPPPESETHVLSSALLPETEQYLRLLGSSSQLLLDASTAARLEQGQRAKVQPSDVWCAEGRGEEVGGREAGENRGGIPYCR